MEYQCCLFDLYGTLVDIRTDEGKPSLWQAMARWYASLGASYTPEALKNAYFSTVRQLEAAGASRFAFPEIRIEDVFSQLFRERGVEAPPRLAADTGIRFRALSLEYIRLYPHARPLLTALRAAGKRVYLLTNAQRLFTMPELERLGIESAFDGIAISSDYGCKKPDPAFYRRALEKFGISPENAVMTGNDGLCDIQGARAVGLKTVYIRSNLSPAEPLPEADRVLPEMDLERLQALLTGTA